MWNLSTLSSHHHLRLAGAAAIVIGCTFMTPNARQVRAAGACTLAQMTANEPGVFMGTPAISGDGRYIAVASTADSFGSNADHSSEIFRIDRTTGNEEQITNQTFSSLNPVIDRDGGRIAYQSQISGLSQIVLWSRGVVGPATQHLITPPSSATSYDHPSLSDDGTVIAFRSTTALSSEGPSSTKQVSLVWREDSDEVTPAISVPLAEGEQDPLAPTLAGDGRHVLVGTTRHSEAATGVTALLRVDLGTGVATKVNGAMNMGIPASDDAGRRVVVGVGSWFSLRLVQPDAKVSSTIVSSTSAKLIDSYSITGRGHRVAFVLADPSGSGPMSLRLRDFGGSGPVTRTIVKTAASLSGVSIDDSGRHVAFVSSSDLVGSNADGADQLYVATCTPPPVAAVCGGALATVLVGRGQSPTSRADVVFGTLGPDVIRSGKGNDIACGRGGADRLEGGTGNDRLVGGAGKDKCLGGSGKDTATGCESISSVP